MARLAWLRACPCQSEQPMISLTVQWTVSEFKLQQIHCMIS